MKKTSKDDFLSQFSDSPGRLAWVESHLSDPSARKALLEAVDDSPYSLGQWVDAFLILRQWLDARGRCASFEDQMGYLHCACPAAGAGAHLTTLAASVDDMLESYGFERAVEKSKASPAPPQ